MHSEEAASLATTVTMAVTADAAPATVSEASSSTGTSDSVEKARGHLERAEKKSKPSMRRWKPKMKVAGDEYCKAAILFYKNGDVEEAKEMLEKACECYSKKRAWHSAAKTLEQVTAIYQKQGDLDTVAKLTWRSAGYFVKAGQPDSAAQLLSRISKDLVKEKPEMSVQMLEKAAETVENENRPIQAAIYTNKLLKIALYKNINENDTDKKNMEVAAARARKMVELYQEAGHKPSTGRCVLGLVLILLSEHDVEEAEIVAREFGNNCTFDQNETIEDLLDAYDQNDEERLQLALRRNCLLSLDWEYITVIKKVAIADEEGPRDRTRIRRLFQKPSSKKKDKSKEEKCSGGGEGKKEAPADKEKNGSIKRKSIKGAPPGGSQEEKSKEKKKVGERNSVGFAHVDVTTDKMRYHTGGGRNLPAPAPHMDVEGIDPLHPSYMGMTIEQWREHKRLMQAEEDEIYADEGGYYGDD